MINRERCEDRDPDRTRYLVTLPEPPVTTADNKRHDDSDQRSEYRANQGVNDRCFTAAVPLALPAESSTCGGADISPARLALEPT